MLRFSARPLPARPALPARFALSAVAAALLATLVLPGSLAGNSPLVQQGEDRRDRVTLADGKELRGRVARRFGKRELLLRQGGKQIRVPVATLRDVHTVNDDIRTFFAFRDKLGDNVKRAWFLVEWAAAHELPGLAQLQALAVIGMDPDFAAAREFLGHRRRRDAWLWPVGSQHVSLAAFEKRHASWGSALELDGEHFRLRTTAGTARAVEILFDLERFYLFWQDMFGPVLDTWEVLEPIDVHVWGSVFDFDGLSSEDAPYYDLSSDKMATSYHPDGKRPEQLFGVATQALLYHTIVGRTEGFSLPAGGMRLVQPRLCSWVELGLGRWMDSAFGGAPGAATAREPELDALITRAVADQRPALKHVIHYAYPLFYEVSPRVSLRWDTVTALVHFLMTEQPEPALRPRFFLLLEKAFRDAMGDSSTAFDKAMGMELEELERRFHRWLVAR